MDAAESMAQPARPVPPAARAAQPRPTSTDAPELSEREIAILAFERQWWKYAGAKERAIRELFNMSPTRYYQVLNNLLDRSDAVRADPMLIRRLRRVRSSRQRARTARRLGFEPNRVAEPNRTAETTRPIEPLRPADRSWCGGLAAGDEHDSSRSTSGDSQ